MIENRTGIGHAGTTTFGGCRKQRKRERKKSFTTYLTTRRDDDALQQLSVYRDSRREIERVPFQKPPILDVLFGTFKGLHEVDPIFILSRFIPENEILFRWKRKKIERKLQETQANEYISREKDARRIFFAFALSIAHLSWRTHGARDATAHRNFSVRTTCGASRCVHSDARTVTLTPSFPSAWI